MLLTPSWIVPVWTSICPYSPARPCVTSDESGVGRTLTRLPKNSNSVRLPLFTNCLEYDSSEAREARSTSSPFGGWRAPRPRDMVTSDT